MKLLVIWAHSYCRSTLAFYRGLGVAFNAPLKLCIWKKNAKLRTRVGFTENEFDDMDITFIGDDYELGRSLLNKYKDAHHIFGAYQAVTIYQNLILDAKRMGCHIGIASEAPCNMTPGYKHFLKEFYIKVVLPMNVRKQITASDFIINLSGNDSEGLKKIGWSEEKIIPCGYYSPKIEHANPVRRSEYSWRNFTILLTGIHQWHRSPMLLVKALAILKKKGITPECNITQEGPLLQQMKELATQEGLGNIHFLGFVSMEKLINLYETCSVYVGSGNNEPWGMRLNDALLCGAPLIVNKGMGGYKLVDDYNCGLTFPRNNHNALADALEAMIKNKELYLEYADAAYNAMANIEPSAKAGDIVNIIKSRFLDWA